MMKHIRSVGTVVAALAASMVLVSATASAQSYPGGKPGELLGGPSEQYRHGDRDDWRGDRDDRRGGRDDDWRRRGPDFSDAVRNCSREAIQIAWRRGDYSAQYEREPRLVSTRRGWELVGRMRLQDRRGFSFVNTVCELRGNANVEDFEILR